MAAARDRRKPRNRSPEQESCGGHESDHNGAPTSLPDGRSRSLEKVSDASLGVWSSEAGAGSDNADDLSPVLCQIPVPSRCCPKSDPCCPRTAAAHLRRGRRGLQSAAKRFAAVTPERPTT